MDKAGKVGWVLFNCKPFILLLDRDILLRVGWFVSFFLPVARPVQIPAPGDLTAGSSSSPLLLPSPSSYGGVA